MGQFFRIFNIDRMTSTSGGGAKLGEWFPYGIENKIIENYLLPKKFTFPPDPLEGRIFGLPKNIGGARFELCDLPTELHVATLNELDDPVDVIAFALTSCYYWKVGIARVKEMYIAHRTAYSDWTGDRIVCLGDGIMDNDWPATMFTQHEVDAWKKSLHDGSSRGVAMAGAEVRRDKNALPRWPDLYHYKERCYRSIATESKRHEELQYAVAEEWFLMEHRRDRETDVDLSKNYVLRNLCKKEFVRADVLALNAEDVSGPFVEGMSLGSLLIAWTLWSSDGASMEYGKIVDMHQGPWAGDRFDITPLEEEGLGTECEDVSAKGKSFMLAVWQAQFEDKWEEMIYQYSL